MASKEDENAEKRVNEIARRLEDIEKIAKNAERRAENAEKKVEDSEKRSENAEKRADNAEKRVNEIGKKAKVDEKKVEDAVKRVEDVQKSVNEMARKFEDAEKKSKEAEKRVEDVQKSINEMARKLEDAEKKSKEAEKRAEDAEKISEKAVMLPYKHEQILLNADEVIDRSSSLKLYNQIRSGIYLKQKSQKYYIDAKGRNCFMVSAKSFTIWYTSGTETKTWSLANESAGGDASLPAYEAIRTDWTQISGDFRADLCNPEIMYEVVFQFMWKDTASGFHGSVNLFLIKFNGPYTSKEVDLKTLKKGEWIEIHMGEFKAPPKETTTVSNIKYFFQDMAFGEKEGVRKFKGSRQTFLAELRHEMLSGVESTYVTKKITIPQHKCLWIFYYMLKRS